MIRLFLDSLASLFITIVDSHRIKPVFPYQAEGHRVLLGKKSKSVSQGKSSQTKASAPGQTKHSKSKGKKSTKKSTSKKKKEKKPKKTGNGKDTAPGQIWKQTGVHPKLIAASPNASFKRDLLRDPDNNVYDDWKDWKSGEEYDVFPTPKPNSSPAPPSPPDPPPAPNPGTGLSSSQQRRIETITNIFEFATKSPQYGYAENIGDGRGITFGRAGFCTGTGDGLMVVKEYTRRKPNNPLAQYLPALQRIDNNRNAETNGDITGLEGFISRVRSLGDDSTFRSVQDWAWAQLYFNPSQRAAAALGLKLPLSLGQLYDAYFMHGENRVSDSFYPKSANGMAAWVNNKLGGSPADGVDEKAWLRAYLNRRRSVLKNTDDVWSKAANRIDIYEWLTNAEIWKMDRPVTLKTGDCGKDGVCSKSSSKVVIVGPSVYGAFTIS